MLPVDRLKQFSLSPTLLVDCKDFSIVILLIHLAMLQSRTVSVGLKIML